jgi:tetratricopeptide (TPR) repeat protein
VGAFTLLGFSLFAYFVMWASGIGPVGNLVAQGVIDEGDRVILAEFSDATGEGLGSVVTEALRVDLGEASVLDLVEHADLGPVLGRMQVEPGTPLTADLALEAAQREGIKAVIDGEVAAVGTGYLVTASIRSAADGRTIASFRSAASGPDEIIASIDKLSQDIREKSGESLRTIRSGEPLDQVTTTSLEALRLYAEADRTFDQGDYRRTIELLEEATGLDPAFAMAWRRLAAVFNNTGLDNARQVNAITQAYENRDRLTERERYLTEAYYYSTVTQDRPATIAAYQNVLDIDPDDQAALNNLANEYQAIEDLDRAAELYRRAIDGPGRSNTAFQNLLRIYIGARKHTDALALLKEYEAAYPGDANLHEFSFWVHFTAGDLDAAVAAAEPYARDPAIPAFVRVGALEELAQVAYWQGRLDEGRRLMLEAERVGREVSPAFAWARRNWTTWIERMVGDEAWGLEHLREGLRAGEFEAIPDPVSRNHFFTTLNLSESGAYEETARILADTTSLGQLLGTSDRLDLKRTALYADVAIGRTEGAVERHQELIAESGCPTCWRTEEAWMALTMGHTEEAIRRYEAILDDGFTFMQLNAPYWLRAMSVLGPLYEEAGDTANAIASYQRLVDRWADGDARGQAKVRVAQARITALGG